MSGDRRSHLRVRQLIRRIPCNLPVAQSLRGGDLTTERIRLLRTPKRPRKQQPANARTSIQPTANFDPQHA